MVLQNYSAKNLRLAVRKHNRGVKGGRENSSYMPGLWKKRKGQLIQHIRKYFDIAETNHGHRLTSKISNNLTHNLIKKVHAARARAARARAARVRAARARGGRGRGQ